MKIEVNIPESLKEIKLRDYQKFVRTCKDSNDELFIQQKMIEIFCGVPLLSVLKMKLSDVEDITNHLNNLFTKQPNLTRKFDITGLEFGFIPNLEKITFAEYIDLDTYIADFDNMHKAMAVLYRPIVDKRKDTYSIEEYTGSDAYSEIMEHVSMEVVIGARVFFWNLSNELLTAIPTYLEKEVSKMNTRKATNLGANGDGINQSIHLLKETLQDLTKLQRLDYLKL
jgi:hypothetical protein